MWCIVSTIKAIVAGTLTVSAHAAGPTREYYVQSFNTMSVLQGTNVNQEFSTSLSFPFVVGSIIREKGWNGATGNDYSLTGTLIGPNGGTSGGDDFFDGTTDGSYQLLG